MIDLAESMERGLVPMKDVAARQEISLKYIERIMPVLVQNGLVEGVHGKGGGYRLTKQPHEYRVGDILRLTEGDLAPVACLECGAKPCSKISECRTLPMWNEFYEMINKYFDSVTLADLMKKEWA
jgi:Rrf2 family protein